MSDYAGRTFEYVSKAELKPAKEQVEKLIRDLQKNLREENVTFDPKLIGSGGKNLVTRVVGGNTGFDFDYNFVIQKDADLSPKDLKLLFIQELQNIIENTQYSNVSNGKQSMVIKVVDKKNSRILHGCDFAIVNEYNDDDDQFNQEILVRNKTTDVYTWNEKPSAKNYTYKVSNLKANGLWNEVRGEYLKLKNNNNDEGKKSFTLFYEAVNNVYSRYNWV
ncbi:MAG: hypothetical protein JEZ05_01405 [Tenericutes bacterium]|nr:hypothetical protein [Mycoplasmatota bacterium]